MQSTQPNIPGRRLSPEDVRTVAPALEAYTQERLYGDVWKRPDLTPRDRSLITVAALIARGQAPALTSYLNQAIENGVKPREISETITPRRSSASRVGWSPCTPRSHRSALPPPSSIPGSFARNSSRSNRRTTLNRPSRTITSGEGRCSRTWKSQNGKQSGDPAKLARAIITIAGQEPPPRRFIAGADAIATTEQKIADLKMQIDANRALSTSLAFDDHLAEVGYRLALPHPARDRCASTNAKEY